MIIPPGVSELDYKTALERFSSIVGAEWVFTNDEDVALYRDAYSPQYGMDTDHVASGAIAPETAEQVQEILRVCNEFRIPIFAFSTGKNLGYGGAAPVYSGSMVLDLKRMNKIIEVNEKNHTAIVEPGVTLFDLYRHIHEKGYKLSMEMMDPAWGSVIGNALDHGCAHTTTYGRDRFHDQCFMEVVLPTGEMVRTGMGAMPGAKSVTEFHYGFGPYVDGIFTQSNFGVVTKMGIQLRPEHEAYRAGLIHVPRFEDLERLIEIETHCVNAGVLNGMTHFGSPVQGPLMGADMSEFAEFMHNRELMEILAVPGRPDSARLEEYGRQNNKGFWAADIKFHGPANVIAAQWEYCKEKFLEIPGAWAEEKGPVVTFPLSPEQEQHLNTAGNAEKVHLGIPSLNRFAFQAQFDDMFSEQLGSKVSGHLFFAPIIPKSAAELMKAQDVFYEALHDMGLKQPPGFFGRMPIGWYHRSFIYLMGLPVTRDAEINRRSTENYRKLIKIAADNGWGEYRTHAMMQDPVMATYSENDHALLGLHEKIKDALDPNGILAAGKSGIWPAHLPDRRNNVRNFFS